MRQFALELKIFPALTLFLGSYFPLSIILLIQDIDSKYWDFSGIYKENLSALIPNLDNPGKSITFFIITTICLLIFRKFINSLNFNSSMKVIESRAIPNDLINYVFPYVISSMGLDLSNTGKFIGFIIFLSLMFIITYRSGQILMNPMLLAAGWQLYELSVDIEGNPRIVKALSKTPVRNDDDLRSCLIHGIYVLNRGIK